jgi:rhodanese-related sulfurtransferase
MRKILYSFLSMVLFSTILSSCSIQNSRLAPDAFEQQLNQSEVLLVDVRTPEEFAQRHLRGAVNIDIYAADFMSRMQALDTTQTLLLYCQSGNRSRKAINMLEHKGFKAVYDLEGGISEWIKQGKVTE